MASIKVSPQAVDAYKTYLYRKGYRSVKEIESIKPGQPIDLKDLDADIDTVEKTIKMCEKVGLPIWEEEYKLKGLKSLRDQLVGRSWPSLADINQKIKEEEKTWLKLKDVQQAKAAAAKAALQEEKAKNTWPPLDKIKKLEGFVNKYQQPGGPWLPMKSKKPKVSTNLGGLNLNQEWIMRVGVSSGLNVTIIQQESFYAGETLMWLKCKVCSSLKRVDRYAVSVNELADDIEMFCRDHRHDGGVAQAPVGRRFRED